MFGKVGNLKISRKLTAAFLVICFVSISLSSVIVSYAAMQNINRRTEVLAEALSAQAASGMEQFVESCRGLMMAVLVDSDVLTALSRGTVPVSEQAEYQTQISRLLFRLIKMQPRLVYAGIVLKSGQTFQNGAAGERKNLAAFAEKDWMRRIAARKYPSDSANLPRRSSSVPYALLARMSPGSRLRASR